MTGGAMTEGASHPEDLNNRHAGEFFTPTEVEDVNQEKIVKSKR